MTFIAQQVQSQAAFGKFGIADANGKYTYYATFQAAIDAAIAGQTVEMFTDVTETGAVEINPKNGVNINLNGHTYTLDGNGLLNTIKLTANMSFTISNGVINRTNGTYDVVNSSPLYTYPRAGIINCQGVEFKSNYGITYYGSTDIIGAEFTSNSPSTGYNFLQTSGELVGCKVFSFGTNRVSGGRVTGCYFKSTSGIGINAWGGVINNCDIQSLGGAACQTSGLATFNHCNFYSSAGLAISSANLSVFNHCTFKSTSTYAMNYLGIFNTCHFESTVSNAVFSQTGAKFKKCTFESPAAAAVYNAADGYFKDCTVKSDWDNVGGHGFKLINATTNGVRIIKCSIEVKNAGAYGVDASTHATTYQYVAGCDLTGSPNLINAINGNSQTLPEDIYGNIIIS